MATLPSSSDVRQVPVSHQSDGPAAGRQRLYRPEAGAVRRGREIRGWTQADLAIYAGCSSASVLRAEEGREVTLKLLQKIAKAFELHPPQAGLAALLGHDGE